MLNSLTGCQHKHSYSRMKQLAWICITLLASSSATDPLGSVFLTPWWDLRFSAGETVIVDCGVYTNGKNISISWIHDNEVLPVSSADRISITEQDSTLLDAKVTAAFTVVTMTIRNLQLSDTGVYTCRSTFGTNVNNESISLTVLDSGAVCGFESEDLCGWKNNITDMPWHRHNGSDPGILKSQKGPRFDHTYGSSKISGHFIDIDLGHEPTAKMGTDQVGVLMSPSYPVHNTPKCFEFWYIYYGRDKVNLSLQLLPDGGSFPTNSTTLWLLKGKSVDVWTHSSVTIPPQSSKYQLLFKSTMCAEKCSKGISALDDFRMSEGSCEAQNVSWPDTRMKVRLVDGPTKDEGRLEILHEGQWGTVCDERFGNNEAKVVCRMMGYNDTIDVTRYRNAHYGEASPGHVVWLQKLNCRGTEADLGYCIGPENGWGSQCAHSEGSGVKCADSEIITTVKDDPTTTETTTKPTTSKPTTTVTVKPTVSPVNDTSIGVGPTKSVPTTLDQKTSTEASLNATTEGQVSHLPVGGPRGVAAGIIITLIILSILIGYFVYRKKKFRRKSKYITFGNPKYSREHLPTNDIISLESPLNNGPIIA